MSENQTDNFSSQYDPKAVEDRIYDQWEKSGAFHSTPNPKRKPYVIPIPPPNVTGVLHIGHALNNTLQDVLIRYRRMQGYETLWMPGTDHAGIATQNVVEKQIAKTEQKNRYQVGRAELINRIWKWKDQFGESILRQLRKLGSSCDWERTRFTMDEGLSRAVRQAFVSLYNDGLIYRGKYLVNWCPRCCTTLSDDEVEHEEVKGKLYELHYPLADGSGQLTVATTRPETMLGDTAVAVHPKDERYTRYVGQFIDLPLTGRRIPVISDDALELGFGTGCLKVTPAHDPVDYQIGLRHKLPMINILTESGTLNDNVPPAYRGMTGSKARVKVLEDLKSQGLVGDVKDHMQQVGHCYRCHTIIEPYLTPQWYVKMKPMSELAIKATESGRVKFHPERWTKVYLQWFREVRDWAISRQIWWGHQIPVWYDLDANREHITEIEVSGDAQFDIERDGKRYRYLIGENAKPIVTLQDPETLPEYKGKRLLRDPDVLDTWFSSGLWPFSTLGWPEKTPELDYYYPTSTLVTDRGIIYFWVARMVIMGEKLTGREPFSDVVIHGTVLDGAGVRMSKSKGNGIDPLDIIHRYGADALRFTIVDMSTEGQDLKLPVQIVCPHCDTEQDLPKKRSVPVMTCAKCKQPFQQPVPNEEPLPEPKMGALDSPRFEKGRNFSNKIWNAARFVLTSIPAYTPIKHEELMKSLRDEDRWIISRVNTAARELTAALDEFQFNKAAAVAYQFFWDEYCSWYIELTKARLSEGGASAAAARAVLLYGLDRSLRMLHPITPFITEALWSELNERAGQPGERDLGRIEYAGKDARQDSKQLITAAWPVAEPALLDPVLEGQFASLFDAVVATRAIRQKLIDYSPKDKKKEVAATLSKPFTLSIRTADAALAERLKDQAHVIMQMANTLKPEIGVNIAPPKPSSATAIKGGTIYVSLGADLLEVEKLRLSGEIQQIRQYIPKVEGKLKNENFVKNAPPELVAEERQRLADAEAKLKSLEAALAEL
jgi:valyl-tRNA synthetase